MYVDLYSKSGKYRGLSRSLDTIKARRVSNKEWSQYFAAYEEYLEWLAKMDNTCCESVLHMLTKLRDISQKLGSDCEIILYSDNPEEFHRGKAFLGFDPYWAEEGISGLEEGCEIPKRYYEKLNENGLFCNYEEALEFCETWKNNLCSAGSEPYGIASLRPFCLWVYTD